MKIQKKIFFLFFSFLFFFWGGGGVGLGGGGQGGCERRSEAFVKIQNIFFCGGGIRVDVNGEVKLL